MIVDRIAERVVRDALLACDVRIGNERPWDIQVRDRSWYRHLIVDPPLRFGESYMDGSWDCDALDELTRRLTASGMRSYEGGFHFHVRNALARLSNPQSRSRASRVAEHHYNLSAELYQSMLDGETMSYTCAVWSEGDSLGKAQLRKLATICRKLDLKPGDQLLDIGCGFGGLAQFAARNYGVDVVGITNSELHARVARERCADLPGVEIHLLDYREIEKLGRRFDGVSAIEMIEAVGPKNFAAYMDVVHRALKPRGRFVIQAFISATSRHVCNPWFDRYIFPGGVSPSTKQIESAARTRFEPLLPVEDIGDHYPATLLAWNRNFEAHWPALSQKFDERFRRMWRFYLLSLVGTFAAKDLALCQLGYARAAGRDW